MWKRLAFFLFFFSFFVKIEAADLSSSRLSVQTCNCILLSHHTFANHIDGIEPSSIPGAHIVSTTDATLLTTHTLTRSQSLFFSLVRSQRIPFLLFLFYSQKLRLVDGRDYNTKQGHLIK